MIIKGKPGSREAQAAKEHKEFVERTENLARTNAEIEEKIAAIKANIEDDERAKTQIQESFSQRLYQLQRQITKLREELRISEQDLTNTAKGQLQVKAEEL
jgi:tRNA(Ser,Leu) C12 N-acetylase TAN1